MFDIKTLLAQVAATEYKSIIMDPEIGLHPNQNEFLIFLKPEIFMDSPEFQEKRIEFINGKLEEFGVTVEGAMIVGGKYIEEKGLMASHYGFINQVSNTASSLVTAEDRKKMTELLGEDCTNTMVLGGHEALRKFQDMTPKALDDFWFTKKSFKIKSGMYFQKYTYAGVDFLLVDGFHPQQLAYFTEPSRRVLLLVCHSMTDWKKLRWDMIGATFPESANEGSIRRSLHDRAGEFGYAKVDIANNGIHFSVGAFEAINELANFVGKTVEKDLLMECDFAKILTSNGLDRTAIEAALKNPVITTKEGVTKDLFGLTEDLNPTAAAELYINRKV
jgi:hypothetical protein